MWKLLLFLLIIQQGCSISTRKKLSGIAAEESKTQPLKKEQGTGTVQVPVLEQRRFGRITSNADIGKVSIFKPTKLPGKSQDWKPQMKWKQSLADELASISADTGIECSRSLHANVNQPFQAGTRDESDKDKEIVHAINNKEWGDQFSKEQHDGSDDESESSCTISIDNEFDDDKSLCDHPIPCY
eukprot:gene11803-13025_t